MRSFLMLCLERRGAHRCGSRSFTRSDYN